MKPHRWTMAQAAELIRSGQVSPTDLLEDLLARIDAIDPRLRAWEIVDRDGARAEAKRQSVEAEAGKFRGALHGIPIGIKDIFYTRGLRTGMGTPVFANFVPDVDAACVGRLRQAGVIILGKTVTTEFAAFDPGPTRNPWDLEHTPGGSSSGSAAAVAARLCPAALGSQTIGSVGRPASFCGVTGFVSSASRIPREGVFPAAPSLDHIGLLTRSVEDVLRLFEVVAGAALEEVRLPAPIRVGIVRRFFYDRASAEMREACETAADEFSRSGAEVGEADPSAILEEAPSILKAIYQKEMAGTHESLFRKHRSLYGSKLKEIIESGSRIPDAEYRRALESRTAYQSALERLFEGFDVLLSPGANSSAPGGLGSTGDPVMNGPWTLADLPTLSLPVTLEGNGLPLGIQLTAARGQEALLLRAGRWCEGVIGFPDVPPEAM